MVTKAAAVDGGFAPIIIVLDAPHVWEGPGVGFRQNQTLSRAQIELSEAERKQVRPLNGQPIRKALMEYIISLEKTDRIGQKTNEKIFEQVRL